VLVDHSGRGYFGQKKNKKTQTGKWKTSGRNFKQTNYLGQNFIVKVGVAGGILVSARTKGVAETGQREFCKFTARGKIGESAFSWVRLGGADVVFYKIRFSTVGLF